jgi:plastocyanin
MTLRLAVSALILAVTLAACASEPPPPAPVNPAAKAVDPATAGAITGRIDFAGTPPPAEVLRMGTDQACVEGAGPNPVSNAVLVGDDGSLQNAFVYIKDGLDPDYAFDTPTEEALLDQVGCVYTPRVLGVMVGQPLKVLNSDPTLHNVHALPMQNMEFNQGQPVQGMHLTHIFTVPEVMVRFMCNVHGWMAAWVGVLPHPYFAVTGADGSFELAGVPPGTYTIEAWHEVFGTRTATVTIAEGQTESISMTFSDQAQPERP